MLGVKNSGKTQFVKSLCGQSYDEVKSLSWKLLIGCAHQHYFRFLIKDPSGQECWPQWREQNYPSTDSFIFVISLDDFPDRIDEVRQALIEALTNTGNKPFMIIMNKRDSSSYSVDARENVVLWNVRFWLNGFTGLMPLQDRRYRIFTCDVKVEGHVQGCFDEIAKCI